MAYTPGTKLSCFDDLEVAVVITENKVICTRGILIGQTMLLVDWLILASGTEIQVNTQAVADNVWTHAKQKAGIDPPSLAHVDLPQLLVPPAPASCCDNQYACGCLELAAAPPAAPPAAPELRFPPPLEALPQRYFGDKLKWELNDETYRIAVFTKKGLLEVKNVEDGGAAVHNKDCTCSPCRDYKMVPRAPWQPRLPLAKTFFADEAAWRASLPQGGKLLTKYVKSPYVKSNYNDWI
jgi:hypothetical protein